ncbi:hypothetical protein GCM10008027_39730 [Pseudoalteromonas gelatinilytica]|uniref:Lipoprotein n=1 Tax=Pseudoalteromonas gelatinilytica TaxID=1703256 RepID=A0ABQ1U884_9GAMM|nr:hypothetical protein GCM10008027_39730 [Pseudoalteromonas profundi]
MKKLLIGLLFLGGCASQGVDRADQNVMIKRFYATVTSVKPVKLSSNVKTGIAAGSAIGLVMLIGLIAKNAILLVEFADQLRD